MSRLKQYKTFFVDKAGNKTEYKDFIYAYDYIEAQERATNIMKGMNNENLSHVIVTRIELSSNNWSGIYR